MNIRLGIAAIVLSILSLIGTFAFGAPPWVNIAGLLCGLFGMFVLTRGRKGG